ncbi:MAG: hypothetical protein H6677_11085 [Candidatus Obscuribacterales bacterium]|nr:hypothetical protein [Candidatus Obscuribacterales bacterium]
MVSKLGEAAETITKKESPSSDETRRSLLQETAPEKLLDGIQKSESVSLSASAGGNGLSLKDLEDISESINSKMDDVAKLGRMARSMKQHDFKFNKGEVQDEKKAWGSRGINSDDLNWALRDVGNEILGPVVKKDETKTCLSKGEADFLSNIVTGSRINLDGAARVNQTDKVLYDSDQFSSEDWSRIREAMDETRSGESHLPSITLTGFERELDKGEPSIKVERDGAETRTYDPETGIRTSTRDGRTVAEVAPDTRVTREGDTTTYESHGRRIFEQHGNEKIFRLKDGTEVHVENGEARMIVDGEPRLIHGLNGMVREMRHGIMVAAREAKTPEAALEAAGQQLDLTTQEKPVMIARAGGLSLVRNGKLVADFADGGDSDKPPEATFYLSETRKLVRTSDGKLLIKEDGKGDIELSREQIEFLVSKLGDNARFISRTLRSLDMGQSVIYDENLTLDVTRNIQGILRNGADRHEDTHFAVDRTGLTMTEKGATTHYDTNTGVLDHKTADGETISLTPTEKNIDVKTAELEMKDGVVRFEGSNTVINNDGSIDLGNGTTIDTSGNVHLGDGRVIQASGQNGERALNQPSEKSLDIYMGFAKSLAASVAGRAASGSVTLSDIAMLKANLSIIGNYMGFFSQLGNLEIVNSLSTSWALVKDSLDKAEPKLREKQEKVQGIQKSK